MLVVAIYTLTAAVTAAMVEASTMPLVRRRTLPVKQNERNELMSIAIEISMSLNQAIPMEMEFNSNIDTIVVGTIDESSSYPTFSPRMTETFDIMSMPKLEQYDMSIALDENSMSMTLFETKAISESVFFLPTSISCLLGGSDVAICCPNFITKTPATDNDGVCSLLGCLNLGGDDDKFLNDGCTCTDIATACDSVALLSSMVSNLPEACESATTCCQTGTSNDDWDTCMSSVQAPDFRSYLPINPNHKEKTESPVSSPTIAIEIISIMLDQTSMSMPPIVLIEMSMSMGTNRPAANQINSPTSSEPTSSPWPSINDKLTVPSSSLPTKSPSKAPVQSSMTAAPTTSSPVSNVESPDIVAFVTKTQLQLTGVYSEMDDPAANIFKQSCVSFLNDFLLDAQTNIHDIKCAIYNQQLLSGRRLGSGELSTLMNGHRMLVPRDLKGESSLLVDVIVDGIATSNDTDSKASVSFTNQVTDTFASHSTEFTRELQDNGRDAGIDYFDDLTLTSVNSPGGEVSEIIDDNSDGPEDNTSKTGQYLAIATIALSGLVIVGLFTLVLHRIRKQSDDLVDESMEPYLSEWIIDEEFESVQLNSLRDQPQRITSIGTLDLSPRDNLTPMNASTGLSYKYSLDEGLASPESILSSLSATGQKVVEWINCKEFTQGNRTEVLAPPGKLGIIIDTCPEGPVVHSIKDNSPLLGLIFTGDMIVAIDDEDTTGWSAHYLTRLVAQKSKVTRKLTVLRSGS